MEQLTHATSARSARACDAGALRRWAWVALLTLLVTVAISRVAAAAEPLKGLALVIGQSEYEHLEPLRTPVNDVRAIEELLNDLGFVTTDAVNRDGARLRRDLDRFVQDADYDKADVALIYYSGHAIEAGGVNYLVPVDGEVSSLESAESDLVALADIIRQLRTKARITIVLLDACRTNPFPEGALLRTATAPDGAAITPSGLAAPKGFFSLEGETSDSLGVVIGFAAEPGRVAYDGAGDLETSPYAAALLRHFAAPGVDFGDVMTMVTEEVYLKTRRQQRPWINASLRRLLYFGGSAEAQTDDEARLNEARRDLLLTISATPQATRTFVETLADQDDLPLDLLYGILKELEVDTTTGPAKLQEQLRAGAENLKTFKAERVIPVRKDPELIRLSALADRAETEGLIPIAKDYRARASERARELKPLVEERLESVRTDFLQFATTFAEEAETAILAFDYATAVLQFDAAYDEARKWDDDLAAYYRHRLGDTHRLIGNSTPALAAHREALSIKERLARSDPDNTERQRDLSVSYNKVGDVLVAQGRLPRALENFKASIAIRKRLVRSDPDNVGWQRDLSVSHDRVGEVLVAQGNLAGALKSFKASIAIRERLASSDPDNAGWQRDLSVSYSYVGDVLVAQGSLQGALDSFKASIAIPERLTRSDPDNAEWQRGLSVSYGKVGDILVAQGSLPSALDVFEASLAIAERLARSDPGNAKWQRDLSVAQAMVGEVMIAQGKLGDALDIYKTSIEIFEHLARSDPDNAGWQRDLSVAQTKVGEVMIAQGDLTGGLDRFKASLAIRKRLARSDPDNAVWQRDLSVSYGMFGDVLIAQGNLQGALDSFKAAHEIFERLARSNPKNAESQRDLSVLYSKVGDILFAQGSHWGALDRFEASLAIRERLAHSDPENAGWQRDLSVAQAKVGEVMIAQGNLAGALDVFKSSLAISERLARSDPDNAVWQRDLAIGHSKLAWVHGRHGGKETQLAHLRAGRAIMVRLLKLHREHAGWQRDLSWFDGQIGLLEN